MTISINQNDLYRLNLRHALPVNQICKPVTSYDYDDPSNSHRFSLSDYWTDITTSEIKSDVAFFLNGNKGTGKSYLNLSLGYLCAKHYVEKIGGHWTDWFNIDYVAIIDPEEQWDLLMLEAKYIVKDFDDRNIGYDSHNWQSPENAAQNNANIVNRTENNIQLTSTPDQGFIDKRARELCNFYGEAERNIPAMKKGMNIAKIFRVDKNPRSGKRFYSYIWHNDRKLVRACIGSSDAELKRLREEYDAKRERNSKKLLRGEFDEYIKKGKKGADKIETGITRQTQRAMDNAAKKGEEYHNFLLLGYSEKEALKEIKVQKATWKKWEAAGWV